MVLPSAFTAYPVILEQLKDRPVAVFLDYDGTLTEIVQRPELAKLNAETRNEIKRLSDCCFLTIVSGRDLEDVRKRVDLDHIGYAGSHGFDILERDGTRFEAADRNAFTMMLKNFAAHIRALLLHVDGLHVEQKAFSLAIHFRNVAPHNIADVKEAVEQSMEMNPGLQMAAGKMVFDIKPKLDWHKGRAVEWFLDRLDAGAAAHERRAFALYIGDDTTDEDAFEMLGERGLGILVAQKDPSEVDKSSAADYRLRDPTEVCSFLSQLADTLCKT